MLAQSHILIQWKLRTLHCSALIALLTALKGWIVLFFNFWIISFRMSSWSATWKASPISNKEISLIFFGPECLLQSLCSGNGNKPTVSKLFTVAWCHLENTAKNRKKLRDFKEIIASFSEAFLQEFRSPTEVCIALSALREARTNTELGSSRRYGCICLPHREAVTTAAHCSISAPHQLPVQPLAACSRLRGLPAKLKVQCVEERCRWWTLRRLEHKGTLDGQEKP